MDRYGREKEGDGIWWLSCRAHDVYFLPVPPPGILLSPNNLKRFACLGGYIWEKKRKPLGLQSISARHFRPCLSGQRAVAIPQMEMTQFTYFVIDTLQPFLPVLKGRTLGKGWCMQFHRETGGEVIFFWLYETSVMGAGLRDGNHKHCKKKPLSKCLWM